MVGLATCVCFGAGYLGARVLLATWVARVGIGAT